MTRPEPPPNWDASDEEWLHELCRPGSAKPETDAAREARMLHQALVGERESMEATPWFVGLASPDLQEQKLEELLFELRRRRLLDPPRRRWRPAVWSLGLAAAAFVAWFALTPLLTSTLRQPTYGEPPVWRGQIHIVRRPVADPRPAAEAMLARLREAGVDAAIYQRDQVFIVELDVSATSLVPIAAILGPEAGPLRTGPTRIEFIAN